MSDDTDTKKSYVEILEQEITGAIDELERPVSGLLLSGFSAGLDLGFSVLLIGTERRVRGTLHTLFGYRLASSRTFAGITEQTVKRPR